MTGVTATTTMFQMAVVAAQRVNTDYTVFTYDANKICDPAH